MGLGGFYKWLDTRAGGILPGGVKPKWDVLRSENWKDGNYRSPETKAANEEYWRKAEIERIKAHKDKWGITEWERQAQLDKNRHYIENQGFDFIKPESKWPWGPEPSLEYLLWDSFRRGKDVPRLPLPLETDTWGHAPVDMSEDERQELESYPPVYRGK